MGGDGSVRGYEMGELGSGLNMVSPPLECIFGISRLYFTCIPPVSNRILGTPLYPCIYISSHFAADPLYPAVSRCIQLYPYVSSCI